jgi:hypothetical protein
MSPAQEKAILSPLTVGCWSNCGLSMPAQVVVAATSRQREEGESLVTVDLLFVSSWRKNSHNVTFVRPPPYHGVLIAKQFLIVNAHPHKS